MAQRSRGRRLGNVFSLRIPPDVRAQLEQLCASDDGPRRLGPWLVWRALSAPGQYPSSAHESNAGAGSTAPGAPGTALPSRGEQASDEHAALPAQLEPPIGERLILDLCAGSGAWSEPYKRAGYRVRRVSLPGEDVRTFRFRERPWGVLAAPPCTEFSLAKNGRARDFAGALSVVDACVRLVSVARPRWWALENPIGLLGRWLGPPRDVWNPCDFGDPWSKRTALWGDFARPKRGPFVPPIDGGGPLCEICHPDDPRCCSVAAHRAVTPAGFARAFFEANP